MILSADYEMRLPIVPATSFQFYADWKLLKNNPEKFYSYFKVRDRFNTQQVVNDAAACNEAEKQN